MFLFKKNEKLLAQPLPNPHNKFKPWVMEILLNGEGLISTVDLLVLTSLGQLLLILQVSIYLQNKLT